MRVCRVETPLEVVVRKVPGNHDVMSLFPAATEIAVKHYPCSGANRFHAWSSGACDIESLNDDVMRSLQQYHPILVAFRGPVDDTVARLSHCLDVNIVTVARIRFISHHEARIRARHHGNQIAASGG